MNNVTLTVGDYYKPDYDIALGLDFFLSHRIYVSRKQGRMYFAYNGGPVFSVQGRGHESAEDVNEAGSGAALASRKDFASALEDLDRACQMEPQVADHFLRRGQVLVSTKQYRKAVIDLGMALSLNPELADARLPRANLRVAMGERDAAGADLRMLDTTLPTQAPERYVMGDLFQRLGLPDQAIRQWDQWLASRAADRNVPEIKAKRCRARVLLDSDLDKALEDCDQAIKREPELAAALDSRGWLRLRRGEPRAALEDFDRALRMEAKFAWSLYGRGIARLRQGEASEGQADIDAARKLQPEIDKQAGRHGLSLEKLVPPSASPG